MPDQDSEAENQKSEKERDQERLSDATKQLTAEKQAEEAAARNQQQAEAVQQQERQANNDREQQTAPGTEHEDERVRLEQEEQERRAQEEERQREREEWAMQEASQRDRQWQEQQREMDKARAAGSGSQKQVLGYTITMDGLYILPKYQPDKGSILGKAVDGVANRIESWREQKRQVRYERARKKIDALQRQYQQARAEREQQKNHDQRSNAQTQTTAQPDKENQGGDMKQNTENLSDRDARLSEVEAEQAANVEQLIAGRQWASQEVMATIDLTQEQLSPLDTPNKPDEPTGTLPPARSGSEDLTAAARESAIHLQENQVSSFGGREVLGERSQTREPQQSSPPSSHRKQKELDGVREIEQKKLKEQDHER